VTAKDKKNMGEMPASQATTSDVGHAIPAEPEQRLRADTYRLLGHLLAAPPDGETLAIFAAAPVSDDDDMLAVAWRMLATSAGRANPLEVTDEFEALFIGVGRGELMPYASWYLTGFLMEKPLAKLRADLATLGFERQDNVSEPEDHAAALCEIMALLAESSDLESLQTQARFFDDYIGPWMAKFFKDMQTSASARFYRAVGQLGEQFIETDQRYLDMVEQPDDMPATGRKTGDSK
jgi:TorA maturation chaperone TorD